MLEAGFEFECAVEDVVAAFAGLPPPLRPTHFSHEEKIGSDADRIDDSKRLASFIVKSQSGFFLSGPGVVYSIRVAVGRSLVCDCFVDVQPESARQLLVHLSKVQPIFGFACMPVERERRNRVTTQQGVNTIESWVGRDTQKYIPGFYWLTLLPHALMKRHGVSLDLVEGVAREHTELDGRQHLFRFYERPEDWHATSVVDELCASLPGIFDIEEIKPRLSTAKDFLELNSLLREWK